MKKPILMSLMSLMSLMVLTANTQAAVPNAFHKDRMSSANVFAAVNECRKAMDNKKSILSEKTTILACSCISDWFRDHMDMLTIPNKAPYDHCLDWAIKMTEKLG